MDSQAQKLLQGALKAIRSGDQELARRAFLETLKRAPESETAWLGLASVTDDTRDRLRILKKLLMLNPQHEQARTALQRLGVDPTVLLETNGSIPPEDALPDAPTTQGERPTREPSADDGAVRFIYNPQRIEHVPQGAVAEAEVDAEAMPIPEPPLEAILRAPEDMTQPIPEAMLEMLESDPAETPVAPSGPLHVPLPQAQAVEQAAEDALHRLEAHAESAPQSAIQWQKKTRGRAGEREYSVFLFQVGAAAATIVLLLGVGVLGLLLTQPQVQAVLFAPTATWSPTPTVTPTSTPGLTNTPSPTPLLSPTPRATLYATVTPGSADPNFPPEPTPFYFPLGVSVDILIENAVRLMEQGHYQEAYAILEDEHALATDTRSGTGSFVAAYYMVQILLHEDDVQRAQTLVETWQEDWGGLANAERYHPLVNVSLARIELAQAAATDDETAAEELLQSAQERLQDVIQFQDSDFAEAYMLLAERHWLAGDSEAALDVLGDALRERLYAHEAVRMQRVRLYRALGDTQAALQDVHILLALNPFSEPALIAQAEIVLEEGNAGLAVLHSQEYLLYYPGSVRGYYLLGRARQAEGKTDLALNAYERGLQGMESDPATVDILVARARLYADRGQYELAMADVERALSLHDDPALRLLLIDMAFHNEAYEVALAEVMRLHDAQSVAEARLQFWEGRILVAMEQDAVRAVSLLQEALQGETLPEADRPLAHATLAMAYSQANNLPAALDAMTAALELEERASWYYLRGQWHEAHAAQTGRSSDWQAALADYERVLSYGSLYDYAFLPDAQARYEALRQRLGL